MIVPSVHGAPVRLDTVPLTLTVSPVFISGMISHLSRLSGSAGLTFPHGGRSASPPLVSAIYQLSASALINGLNTSDSLVKVVWFPDHSIGQSLPAFAVLYSSVLANAFSFHKLDHEPYVPS